MYCTIKRIAKFLDFFYFLEYNLESKKLQIKEKIMRAIEIRNKYLNFFKEHGHSVIPSAPLIPENDPSVLFTTAGMQPLVPIY